MSQIATPGRLIDHLRNTQSFGIEDLEILILDEADRLLDMGFSAEVEEILRMCPLGRQTMLFSATMTDDVARLAKLSLKNPLRVAIDNKFDVCVTFSFSSDSHFHHRFQTASTLTQEIVRIRPGHEGKREAVLFGSTHHLYHVFKFPPLITLI